MKATIDFKNLKNYSIGYYVVDSFDELSQLTDVAPGSLAIVGKKAYVYNNNWQFLFNITNKKTNSLKYSYTKLKTIDNYLSEIYYDEINYEKAKKYFKETTEPGLVGACSAVRNGNFFGRHLDWEYNDLQAYVIKVPEKEDRYASIGIAGYFKGLTKDVAESKERNDLYELLPFKTLDGINSQSVVANVNVVPIEEDNKFATIITEPTEEQEDEICGTMLVRYILDKFATAREAVEYISKHVKVYIEPRLTDIHFVSHFMVADTTETFILEPVNGVMNIIENPKAMTNFYLTDISFNENGKLNTMEERTNDETLSNNNITPHGAGVERYNIIIDNYDICDSTLGMTNLMNQLMYTNAYKDISPFWYSEYVADEITNDTKITNEFLQEQIRLIKYAYEHRVRNPEDTSGYYGTWQTSHQVIYDIQEKTMRVCVQENADEVFVYDFTMNYTHEEAIQRDNDIFKTIEG